MRMTIPFFAASLLTLSLCIFAYAQERPTTPSAQQLYLLAATPAEDGGYPATLYRVAASKLNVVRQVVPQSEGIRSVRAWGGTIFLIHPGLVPQAVTVIEAADPTDADDVEINPNYPEYFFVTNEAIADRGGSSLDELMMASKDGLSPETVRWIGVSNQATSESRIKLDSWNEYFDLRDEGEPGGPFATGRLVGAVSEGNLILAPIFGLPAVVLDSLSPMVIQAISQTAMKRVEILAASADYLLFSLDYSWEEMFSKGHSADTELFVHDRPHNSWTAIQVEGNRSRFRLLGPWLAAIVGSFNPDNRPSPGRENERGPEGLSSNEIPGGRGSDGTAPFPIVRNLYTQFSPSNFVPGVLLLQNLADGRKIRIETDQEDSEVVAIRDDAILYRVNDSLYQAKIVGSEIQGTTLLVKDQDVPEIHWALWGPPNPAPSETTPQGTSR